MCVCMCVHFSLVFPVSVCLCYIGLSLCCPVPSIVNKDDYIDMTYLVLVTYLLSRSSLSQRYRVWDNKGGPKGVARSVHAVTI